MMTSAHIATADTGISNIQKGVVGVLELWNGAVFKLDLVDPLKDKR